jgi:EAL domain-containing protein (putative c-di-GMP-specific phosphodiesterase class I)
VEKRTLSLICRANAPFMPFSILREFFFLHYQRVQKSFANIVLKWIRDKVQPAEDGLLRDVRQAPPKLRPFAVACLAVVVFLLTTAVGVLLCTEQLRSDLAARLKLSDQALSQVIADIDRDLQHLTSKKAVLFSCDMDTQQDLTRMAINSVLVREFFLQASTGEEVCGSFGQTNATWRLKRNINEAPIDSRDQLQIVPSESIRSGIIVARPLEGQFAVAIIDPRQLLDRIPSHRDGEILTLNTTGGFTLASLGGREPTAMLVEPIDKSLSGWPLVLRGAVSDQQMLNALSSQLFFWIIASVLLTILLVIGINRYWRRQSSKAVRLQRALRKRRFAPVVQPIVCSKTGVCVGVEVLIRWKHPVRGLVAPAEFIDYAERSGLIVPMSDLLMRQAHQQLADVAIANPALYFSFNVTPVQLASPFFTQTLLEIFDGSPLGPERVLLELTERDLVDEQVRAELTRLRAKGFKIAIDDFGTGQSSLSVLQDLAIDKLKIDRAFVNTISQDVNGQPVLDAIISLAHRLNLDMVAEGIEEIAQANYLRKKNVHAMQGYFFAKPMTPLDFSSWIRTNLHVTNSQTPATAQNVVLDLNQALQDLQSARREIERNRWNYLRRHKNCILGNELVSWLAAHYKLQRKDALRLGKRLVARGYVVHVFEEHDLEDQPFFYRLLSMDAVNESRGGALQINKPTSQILAWLQGKNGVIPGKRYHRGLAFRDAVSGSELVEALVRAGGLDRSQAHAAGVQLMRQGLIKHSFDELGFMDSKAHHYHLVN